MARLSQSAMDFPSGPMVRPGFRKAISLPPDLERVCQRNGEQRPFMLAQQSHAGSTKITQGQLSGTTPSLLVVSATMMLSLIIVAVAIVCNILSSGLLQRLLDTNFSLDRPSDDSFNPVTEALMKQFPGQYMDTWEGIDVSLKAYVAEARPGHNKMIFMLYTDPGEQLSADCLAERSAYLVRDSLNAPVYTIVDVRLLSEVTTGSKELVDTIKKAIRSITVYHVVILRGFEKLPDEVASELINFMMKTDQEKSMFYIVEAYVEKKNGGIKDVVDYMMYPSMGAVVKELVTEVYEIPKPISAAKNFLDNYVLVSTESKDDLRQTCPNLINI